MCYLTRFVLRFFIIFLIIFLLVFSLYVLISVYTCNFMQNFYPSYVHKYIVTVLFSTHLIMTEARSKRRVLPLIVIVESEQKQKFQSTKSSVSHAKRKYESTLNNFSLSSQQLVPNLILYPCKCPGVHSRGILTQV